MRERYLGQIVTNMCALVIIKVCSIALAFIMHFYVLRDCNCESFDELDCRDSRKTNHIGNLSDRMIGRVAINTMVHGAL